MEASNSRGFIPALVHKLHTRNERPFPGERFLIGEILEHPD
jgi:hypothetical protein